MLRHAEVGAINRYTPVGLTHVTQRGYFTVHPGQWGDVFEPSQRALWKQEAKFSCIGTRKSAVMA